MAIELIHGDCMDYLRTLPDKAFELAIVDPPYGIGAPSMNMGVNNTRVRDGRSATAVEAQKKNRLNSGGGKLKNRTLNTSEIDWDSQTPSQEYFNELRRVSVNQIIWGGNYFTDKLPASRCWICWDKCQPWDNFSQFELAYTSFDAPCALFKHSNTGGNPEKMIKIHPTQKPEKLYRFCLSKYTKQGDKILDTHLGSAASAIAAHQLGFDFVGIELKQSYYDAAVKRFNNAKMQTKLF